MEEGIALQLMDMVNKSIGDLRESIEGKIDSIDEKVDHVTERINEIDRNVSVHVAEHEIRIKQIETDHALRIKELEKSIESYNKSMWLYAFIKKWVINKYVIPIAIAIFLIIRGTFGAHIEPYVDKYLGYHPKVMQIDTLKKIPKKDSL